MMWNMACHPPSLGYFERAPPRSRVPSGGHRSGRRFEAVEVPQDGFDEADEGRSDAAVGLHRTRQECLDGHAAGVLIAQIALQVRVVDARPSRVRILGHHQICWHHVLFRSRVRLCDVHGGSRPVWGLERHLGAPVNLLSNALLNETSEMAVAKVSSLNGRRETGHGFKSLELSNINGKT